MLKNLLTIVYFIGLVSWASAARVDSIQPVQDKLVFSLVADCKLSNPQLNEKEATKKMEKAVADAALFYHEFLSVMDISVDQSTGDIKNFFLETIDIDSLPYDQQLMSGIVFHYNNNTAFISALISHFYSEYLGVKTYIAASGKSVFYMREMILLLMVNSFPKSFAFNYALSRHYYDKGVEIITDFDLINDPMEKLLEAEDEATAFFDKAEPYFQKSYELMPQRALQLFDESSIIWGGPKNK